MSHPHNDDHIFSQADQDSTDIFDLDSLTAKLIDILDEYVDALKEGQAPSREELINLHPELASQLDACLAGVEFIYGSDSSSPAAPHNLGDFEILHEVGRGGMGAVYEARQISLDRKVALKVLRFGAVSDPDAITRFKREARTVADLHHTNIVPIFSVGNENGVNYYAMQFIEGKSLDKILNEKQDPLDPIVVANWGLQASEALAHAHERDVIHRDVKPSNLLLANDGRIWLTDFGLAKRLDDVTLSLTGALLGTPRYMSPEQATSTIKSVDHRTDIYSLGATLYELVTGQPVFTADTPHGIINEILNSEPVSPRKYRQNLPRDIETILLKCLSKDASQRYSSAQELSEDLRAVVEDRPIRAQRPSPIQRIRHWMKKRKRSLTLNAAAVVLTTLTIGAIYGGARAYHQWNLATMMLNSDQPGLVVEISSNDMPPSLEVLPTQEPLEVNSGDIGIRVSSHGQLSQDFTTKLKPGEQASFEISLNDQHLGKPIQIERSSRLVQFSNGVDPVLLNQKNIKRWDPQYDSSIWTLDLSESAKQSLLPGAKPIRWPWRQFSSPFHSGSKFDQEPFIIGQIENGTSQSTEKPFDIDQDGEVDLIVASREEAWLLAVSGRTGKVLWLAQRGTEVDPKRFVAPIKNEVRHANVAPPIVAGDLDDDQVPDLIAMFADVEELDLRIAGPDQKPIKRWVEAISGRTGESLWSSTIPDDWFILPTGVDEVPYEFRWFIGLEEGTLSQGWGGTHKSGDILLRSRDLQRIRTGSFGWIPSAPQIINLPADSSPESYDENRVVVLMAGTRLVQLSLQNGEPISVPKETGVLNSLPPKFADLDGDGHKDVLLAEERPRIKTDEFLDLHGQIPQIRLAVWSIAQGKLLWQRDLSAHWPRSTRVGVPVPQWPLVTDLNGNQAFEIVVPHGTTDNRVHSGRAKAPWGEVTLLDGATGKSLWNHRTFNLDQQIDHFIDGPDLDHDGTRDIFVASLWGKEFEIFVDALSGTDGHSLWKNSYRLNRNSENITEFWIGNLAWWNGGKSEWPQLAVSVHPDMHARQSPSVHFFSSQYGRFEQVVHGAQSFRMGDVNLDEIDELYVDVPRRDRTQQFSEARLFQGVSKENWRQLGPAKNVVHDLDSDGVRDTLLQTGANQLTASSTISNNQLWTADVDVPELRQFEVLNQRSDSTVGMFPSPGSGQHDFNHDGVPDLLLGLHFHHHQKFSPIHALSGKTGEILWKSEFQVNVSGGTQTTQFYDLDQDGTQEVIYIGANDLDYPDRGSLSTQEVQLWLIILSANDGRVIWKRPLTPAYGLQPQFGPHHLRLESLRISPAIADLNGDSVLDLVVPSETDVLLPAGNDRNIEWVAINGMNGVPLWQAPLMKLRNNYARLNSVPPALAIDLDADGTEEIVTLDFEDRDQKQPHRFAILRAREGSTGQIRWVWETEVNTSFGTINHLNEIASRPRPIALKTNTGLPILAIVLRNYYTTEPFEAAVLTHKGELLNKFAITSIQGYAPTHHIVAYDVDENGSDEIVYWDRKSLIAVQPNKPEAPLWKIDIPTRFNASLAGFFPTANSGHFILRKGLKDNSLIGVNANTGNIDWYCTGPTPSHDLENVELLGQIKNSPPCVLYQFGNVSICRQASELGGRHDSVWTAVPKLISNQTATDPRNLRDLPWRLRFDDPDVAQMIRIGKLSVFYSFTLILIPLGISILLWKRNNFDGWSVLGVMFAVASVLAGFAVGDAQEETHMRLGRIVLAISVLPVFQFFSEIIWLIVSKRRKHVLAWLGVMIVVSMGLAFFTLVYHRSNTLYSLQPNEQYSLKGWYLIFVWGIYITGIAMILVVAIRRVISLTQKAFLCLRGRVAMDGLGIF